MSETFEQGLSSIAETMLIPLYIRAMESERPDALMKDERAVELVTQMSYDFDRVRKIPMTEANKVARIMLTREMDRYARDFLNRHEDGVVVHVGCGLDSRFDRVVEPDSRAQWFDLDVPHVIELRRTYVGDETGRYHLLGCSVLDDAWLEAVKAYSQRPFLFLAETVFVYFSEAQVRSLVLTIRDHFPGAELVCDGWTPLLVWLANRQLTLSSSKVGAGLLRWGIWRGRELEGWGEGIRLLSEWGFFDRPEPRLAHIRWWWRPLETLVKTQRIYRFQLGES